MITAPCINGRGYLSTRRIIQILSNIISGLAMVDNQIGSIKKARCPSCDGSRNCKIEGHFKKTESDGEVDFWTDYYLLVCQGCNSIFFQIEHRNSKEVHSGLDFNGRYFHKYISTIKTWPSPLKRLIPERFKKYEDHIYYNYSKLLGRMLEEVYEAYDKDLLILASVGIRTCFDIVSTSLGIDPNLSFAKKLEKLRDGGYVTQDEMDILTVLVEAGNASAHRGWSPTSQDVNILLNILDNFIENTIIKPIETKILEEPVATIKEKLPPRPPRLPRKK